MNRAEGGRLFPATMPQGLAPGTPLFRNADHAFDQLLGRPSAERRLTLDIRLSETDGGYRLSLDDEAGRHTTLDVCAPHDDARTPQADNLRRQLTRLGDTPYAAGRVELDLRGERFIPASQLAEWRRQAVGALLSQPARQTRTRILYDKAADHADASTAYTTRELDYTANVANRLARDYYASHGISRTAPAYELRPPHEAVLMTCRHCLRAELGHCARRHDAPRPPGANPLALRLPDGRRFPPEFRLPPLPDARPCATLRPSSPSCSRRSWPPPATTPRRRPTTAGP